MRRTTLILALAALAFPAQALAHASLEHTFPKFGQRVETAPKSVQLWFDQGVTALPNSIEVLAPNGRVVSGRTRDLPDRRGVDVAVRPLPKDPYTVRWHVISGDGHVISGLFTFGVRVPAPPPSEAVGAQGPTRVEHVVRWAYFLALALLIGGLGFRLLVVRGPLPAAAERRFYIVSTLGVAAVLEVGILAFLLRSEDALQLPFGRLLYGDLTPLVQGTRFGEAFIAMTLGFALVAALLFLAWLTDARRVLWAPFLIALGFASGLSLSGHSAVDAGASWKSELADWVHLSAASLWIGGLVQLAVVVWPCAPGLRRRTFLAFSRYATVLIALILAAGIYLSILRLPHLRDLWSSGYGQVLLVKLSLVSLALAWGGLHHFVARPALERGTDDGVLGRLARSIVGETAVAMAVLLLAAILVDSKPPPRVPQVTPATASAPERR